MWLNIRCKHRADVHVDLIGINFWGLIGQPGKA